MKKIFTLIAVAMMAMSVNAQTYKSVTGVEYYPLTVDNVASANSDGWAVIGDNRTDNKKSTINPETGESQASTTTPGVGIKKGNASKSIKIYVTGANFVGFIGNSTGSEVRGAKVTATPESGTEVSDNFTTDATTIMKGLELNASSNYTVTFEGVSEDGNDAKDFVVFGLVLSNKGIPTGINTVKAADVENAPAYNLAGQKVNDSYKGVVVKAGKKIVNK